MTNPIQAKALRFQELHQAQEIFLIPNPWDVGSARMMEHMGFQALTTSSSAFAATLGRRDGGISRDELLVHVQLISEATTIPLAADLEGGFGSDPADVEETIRLAGTAGLVGGSIEDYLGSGSRGQIDIGHATERIAASVSGARALPHPFVLTARAENFFRGNPNLDDAIKRLVAYEKAGADVLFAPALPDLAAVKEVCAAVSKPVNFMVGLPGKSFSVSELAQAGVRRVSFASSLYRAAMGGLSRALQEIKAGGTFEYLKDSLPTAALNQFLPEK